MRFGGRHGNGFVINYDKPRQVLRTPGVTPGTILKIGRILQTATRIHGDGHGVSPATAEDPA